MCTTSNDRMAYYPRKRKFTSNKRKSFKRFKPTTKRTFKKAFSKKRVNNKKFTQPNLTGKPKKTGTGHWLSFGKGVYSNKRIGFLKKLERVLSPQKTLYNNAGAITNTPGVQSAQIVGSMYGPYDVNYQNGGGGAIPATYNKVILKDAEQKTFITNQTNAPAFVTIYDCIVRRDNVSDETHLKDPVHAWTTDPVAAAGITLINGVPFDSQQLTVYYKITKVTKLNLALGETAEHIVKCKPQRIWNHMIDATQQADTTNPEVQWVGGYKNLTTFTFIVSHGCPADSDNTTVSTTEAKIDWVTSVRYCYELVDTIGPSYTATNNLGTAASHIMDTGTGTDVAVTEA